MHTTSLVTHLKVALRAGCRRPPSAQLQCNLRPLHSATCIRPCNCKLADVGGQSALQRRYQVVCIGQAASEAPTLSLSPPLSLSPQCNVQPVHSTQVSKPHAYTIVHENKEARDARCAGRAAGQQRAAGCPLPAPRFHDCCMRRRHASASCRLQEGVAEAQPRAASQTTAADEHLHA